MFSNDIRSIFQTLNRRRQDLRMSYAIVARRSGVSLPTVVRILTGHSPHASMENVWSIAASLGMDLCLAPQAEPGAILETQATRKAQQLVGRVQGTSALECQAVDQQTIEALTRQTVHELLAGSAIRLWSE